MSILIVGAGPTGLVLAMALARRGINFRIIDRREGPGLASRAIAVHARTLEFYDQFGFADRIVDAGIKAEHIRLREGGRQVAHIDIDGMGGDLSPYPFMLCYPQDDHERFLVAELAGLGVHVEWHTELTELKERADEVHVVLRRGSEDVATRFAWVAGCDGIHSQVRHSLDIGFEGGTYDHLFYVADTRLDGPPDSDLVMHLGARSFALKMPVRSRAAHRLVGLMPPEAVPETATFDSVRPEVEALLGLQVAAVNWFSTYRVHHRVATRFRRGRCFLLGDAGHVHSPAGGQGMNTGIGDAINLGWKLAGVCRGTATPALLDSYEGERIAFARTLVATTDRVFQAMVSPGVAGTAVRTLLMPILMPVLTGIGLLTRSLFESVSQVRLHYPDSPLSHGHAGEIAGGDRLPWAGRAADNFTPLRSLDWQLHVHGTPTPEIAFTAQRLGLPVHAFPWSEGAEEAGYACDAAYLVRPDGYVALAGVDAGGLAGYVAEHRIDPRRRAG